MKSNRRSIGLEAKLIGAAVANVIFALVACGLILVAFEISTTRERVEVQMSALARVLAATCAPALFIDDRAAAGRTLDAILAEPDALGAAVYDRGGRLLVVAQRGKSPLFAKWRESSGHGTSEFSRKPSVAIPVEMAGEPIGTLVVAFSLASAWTNVSRFAAVVTAAAVIAASGAILVARWLSRTVAAPIEALSDAVRKMTEHRDYSQRVPAGTDDAIGTLVQAFNALAEEVEKREADLRLTNRELERRVARQTRYLIEAYEAARAARELGERRKLEGEIVEISNRERARIAHDLHDDLGQRLVSMAMIAKAIALKMKDTAGAEAERLAGLAHAASDSVALVRRIAHGLDPLDAGAKNLPEALNELVNQVQQTSSMGFWIRVSDPLPQDIHHDVAVVLYRIAQEAIRNAVRHSHATNIVLELRALPEDALELRVTDDGAGLRPAPPGDPGLGLKIMRYRAASVGGMLSVEALGAQGTSVTCRVPKSPPSPPADTGS